MKALTLYCRQEIDLRKLLKKLDDYGELNCDFNTFAKLYNKWHQKTFPGRPIITGAATFRDDWFVDFVNFLANADI